MKEITDRIEGDVLFIALATMSSNSSHNAAHYERSLSTSAVDHTITKQLCNLRQKDQNGNEQEAVDKSEAEQGVNGSMENAENVSCSHRNGHAEEEVNTVEKIAALQVESNGLSTVCEEEKNEKMRGGVLGKPPLPRNKQASGAGKQSWLLRLFESKMFDMSIAISYLFNSKEPGVQTYLGLYHLLPNGYLKKTRLVMKSKSV